MVDMFSMSQVGKAQYEASPHIRNIPKTRTLVKVYHGEDYFYYVLAIVILVNIW